LARKCYTRLSRDLFITYGGILTAFLAYCFSRLTAFLSLLLFSDFSSLPMSRQSHFVTVSEVHLVGMEDNIQSRRRNISQDYRTGMIPPTICRSRETNGRRPFPGVIAGSRGWRLEALLCLRGLAMPNPPTGWQKAECGTVDITGKAAA
jgi:hypothetical protein